MGSCLTTFIQVLLACLTLAVANDAAMKYEDAGTKYEKIDFFTSKEQGYDPRARPKEGEGPLRVGLSGYVLDVIPEKSHNRYFATVIMYFRQFWRKERLFGDREENNDGIYLRDLNGLWHPDTFFPMEIKMPSTPAEQFVRITGTDDILWSQCLQKKFPCEKDQEKNALSCVMDIDSYHHHLEDMYFRLENGPKYSFEGDEEIPGFTGIDTKVIEASLSSGNYSRVSVKINL